LIFLEKISSILLSSAEYQVLINLANTLLLLSLLVCLLSLLILLIHLLVLCMNPLFEPLIERVTPLYHRPHPFSLTLERQMTPKALLRPHRHAYVLELLLNHLLRLRMEESVDLELQIFLLLGLLFTLAHHLIVSPLHE
jgi:hypothetical protein